MALAIAQVFLVYIVIVSVAQPEAFLYRRHNGAASIKIRAPSSWCHVNSSLQKWRCAKNEQSGGYSECIGAHGSLLRM
jgi:hypothetical protein